MQRSQFYDIEVIREITTAIQTQDTRSTSYPYYVLKDKKEEWGFFLTEGMAIEFLSSRSHPLNRKNTYTYAKSGHMCGHYSSLYTLIKSGELLRKAQIATDKPKTNLVSELEILNKEIATPNELDTMTKVAKAILPFLELPGKDAKV